MESVDKKPVVSIWCLVYNHEPFLRQCLDGFVMQQTNFRFEAVVHDDVSADGSADIIREYAARYPDIIKPIFEKNNQYSKKDGSLERIMIAACTGKYIALCEGDDFWIDSHKLQRQVDFLEANPGYSMCFHNAIEHLEDGSNQDKLFSNVNNQDYTGEYIYEKWIIPTASVVLCRDVFISEYYANLMVNPNFCFGDILLFISAAKMGKLRGMDFVGSVYRRQQNGMVFNTSDIKFFFHNLEIFKVIGGGYKEHARRLFFDYGIPLFFNLDDKKTKRIIMKNCFKANPIKAMWGFIKYGFNKMF